MRAVHASRDAVETLWRSAQVVAPWQVPLLSAVRQKRVRLATVLPGARLPLGVLDMVKRPRPLVVIICGDAGAPLGPDAFPQIARLMRWAGFVILHGAGGEPEHYQAAVEAAATYRRLLLVEIEGSALPAWVASKIDLAPRTPGIIWRVPEGKPQHPVRSTAH